MAGIKGRTAWEVDDDALKAAGDGHLHAQSPDGGRRGPGLSHHSLQSTTTVPVFEGVRAAGGRALCAGGGHSSGDATRRYLQGLHIAQQGDYMPRSDKRQDPSSVHYDSHDPSCQRRRGEWASSLSASELCVVLGSMSLQTVSPTAGIPNGSVGGHTAGTRVR